MLSADEARAKLLDNARPVLETEAIPADAALGRVLAEPLIAEVTVPPLDNSAMDGYALRLADWAEDKWLHVAQRIPAGQLGHPLTLGTAARIFTGAPIPEGADTVAMQEDCETKDDHVRILKAPKPGGNIRRVGEDIARGQTVLHIGDRLSAAQLGVAASVGATELTVHRRLRVALFFTGDEIVLPGHPLKPGQIYNSNRTTLLALLQGLGCEVRDLGIVADNFDATVNALEQAGRHADVVITSGGVSVGEEDHVKAAVETLGHIEMWKVAMKPGKPLVYGQIGDSDFLGLPGNPVSAFVVFCLFVRPFLLARMGATNTQALSFTVPAAFDWKKPGQRREFLRAKIENGRAVLYPNQSSGVLTSAAWADGLVDIDTGHTVHEGDSVRFWPLAELLK